MATYLAFNSLLSEFANELANVYPQEQSVLLFKTMLPDIIARAPEKPMEMFTEIYGPYGEQIQNADESLFDIVPDLWGVPIATLYKNATPTTKSSMWQYVQSLQMMVTATSAIPPDVMDKITTLAQNMSERLGEGEELDIMSIMSEMPGLMSTMFASTGEDSTHNLLQYP